MAKGIASMDEHLVSSKSYAKQKFRGGHRGGRRGVGRGQGRGQPDAAGVHGTAPEANQDDGEVEEYYENEEGEGEEASNAADHRERKDFASLIEETRSYYEQSFYRSQSFYDVDKESILPPPDLNIDRSIIALDLPSLAESLLDGLTLSEILGIEEKYLASCLEGRREATSGMAPSTSSAGPHPPSSLSSVPRAETINQTPKKEEIVTKVKEPQATTAPATEPSAHKAVTSISAENDEDDLDALLNLSSTKDPQPPPKPLLPPARTIAAVTLPPKQTVVIPTARETKPATDKVNKSLKDWLDD